MPTPRPKSAAAPRKIFRDRDIEHSMHEAAEIAVKVLRKYHGKLGGGAGRFENKGAIDLVTKADQEAEQRVLDYLRRRHPEHAILAEESFSGERVVPPGLTWVVDPLDGTTNYAHGLLHYAFTIAVVDDGIPLAGLIVDPERGHVYRALRGRGAFRNTKRIHVSATTKLADSLLVTGFPYDRRKHLRELMTVYGEFIKRTHGVRRYGVASLDLALTAAGQFDGYYEQGLWPWDVAAGWLLTEEAGGKVSDYEGRPYELFAPGIVAGPPEIHRQIVRVLRATRRELQAGAR